MDLSLFYAIHSLAGVSAWGDLLIVFFAKYYLYVVLAVFAYAAWSAYGQARERVWLWKYGIALAAAFFARFGLAEVIRYFYHHERPFVALGVSHLITDTAYSFPSGHAIFIFALGAATHFFNKKLAYFLYASGLLIGIARIAGGVHYPSDILGGAVLGLITGAVVCWVAKRYLAR